MSTFIRYNCVVRHPLRHPLRHPRRRHRRHPHFRHPRCRHLLFRHPLLRHPLLCHPLLCRPLLRQPHNIIPLGMVEKDIGDFLTIFAQTPQTLTDFNSLWREKNMSCALYCSPNPKERTDYIRELYEYLVVGIDLSLLVGKGPFLLLYSYFTLQPPNPWQRINIPITKPELVKFKSSMQAFSSCQVSEHVTCNHRSLR